MRNGSEKLLVRVDARAAELEDYRRRLGSPHDSSNRFRDIFHIGRLQSGPTAAEHRIDWKSAKELEDDEIERPLEEIDLTDFSGHLGPLGNQYVRHGVTTPLECQ